MRMFVFRVKPTAAIPNAADVGGALAHVWVDSTDDREAEDRARGYVMAYGWLIEAVEYAFAPTPAQIDALGASEARLRQIALRHGVAADFVGYPRESRPEDPPVEIRRLAKPPGSDSKQ